MPESTLSAEMRDVTLIRRPVRRVLCEAFSTFAGMEIRASSCSYRSMIGTMRSLKLTVDDPGLNFPKWIFRAKLRNFRKKIPHIANVLMLLPLEEHCRFN
jgi:hypothetical protein